MRNINNLANELMRLNIDVKIDKLKGGCIGIVHDPSRSKIVQYTAQKIGYTLILAHEYVYSYGTAGNLPQTIVF